ncbi:MAG: 4-hydroxy-tetrahydrodipicolinate synthase [Candidatus Izemoplasma sp.]|nr:4-hydroxy-tetrahydrodipicolinate synthase [Candidatus Izemoplasma sp.]
MFKGSLVAIVTPFDQQGGVHYEKLTELLNWHVEQKTDGIIILGTTGEAPTLSKTEKLAVFEHTVKVIDGRIPVIAGTGSNNTSATIQFSQETEKLGVDGLLVVTPYYNKGNRQGIIEHYKAINNAVNIPIIVYNVPSRTGVNLEVDVVKELSSFSHIVGLKEASGDLSYFGQIQAATPKEFLLFSGNDDVVLPTLSLGGSGVISVAANVIPRPFHDMVEAFLNNDLQKAIELQLHYMDLINGLFVEVNPVPVKAVLNLMGKNVGEYRLPLAPPTNDTLTLLQDLVRRYDL